MNFRNFESKYYDFYRFSSLVKDLIINFYDLSIPYDIEMKIIYDSYLTVDESLLEKDSNLDPYYLHVNHIKKDITLLKNLLKANENE